VTALGTPSSTLAHLHRHGIGERLPRRLVVDRVAVEVHERVQLRQGLAAVPGEDRQARRPQPPPVQADRVLARGRERRLARPWRLAAVEAVDVPEQVVGALHLVEDPPPLLGPRDGRTIVLVQQLGEIGEALVELGPVPRVERRSTDVVDGSEGDHGGSPERGC
jgi:hypothetical protein